MKKQRKLRSISGFLVVKDEEDDDYIKSKKDKFVKNRSIRGSTIRSRKALSKPRATKKPPSDILARLLRNPAPTPPRSEKEKTQRPSEYIRRRHKNIPNANRIQHAPEASIRRPTDVPAPPLSILQQAAAAVPH